MGLVTMRQSIKELHDLVQFIRQKADGKKLVMVEVGSYQGESMEIFATSNGIQKIVCIDPWKEGYDPRDVASKSDMAEVEAAFDRRAQKVKDIVEVIKHKGTLDTFIKSQEFEELKGKIDFVYIDANHTYEAAKHDIEVCKEMIKPNVAFAGHDYQSDWIGVVKAVDEKLGHPDVVYGDYSWIKIV